jgi:hypothetical protein
MQNRNIGANLIVIGVLGLIGSLVWWFYFYSKVSQAFGGKTSILADGQTIQCLFWNSGPCGLVTGIASAAGEFAYQPMALWISAVLLVIGLVMRSAPKS